MTKLRSKTPPDISEVIHKAIKRHAGLSDWDDEWVAEEVGVILRASKAKPLSTMQITFEKWFGREARHEFDVEYNRAFAAYSAGWKAHGDDQDFRREYSH